MAINFLNSVDFNKNELLNPTIENQPNDTAAGTGVEGQLYFNTTDDILKVYANGAWVEVGGGVTSLTTTDGTYINLTPNSATTGAVTVTADLSAVDGTAGVGERYLTKNNKWATVASIPGTYTFTTESNTGSETVDSGDNLIISGGTYITGAVSKVGQDITNRLDHDSTSRTDTTSTDAPGYGGTFEAVTSVTTNATGHVTAIDVSTVTIPASDDTTYQLSVGAGAADTAVVTLDASSGTDTTLTIGVQDQALTISETTGVNGTITLGLNSSIQKNITFTEDVVIQGELEMGGSIDMSSNSITNLLDPTNDQDAATKAYVDGLVEGGLTFKDGFNATTGAIDGGGNLTSGGSRVAISVGDYYVVTTAGDFYGDSSYPLTVGDSVIAKEDAAAGASTVTDWVIVQGDEGVVDLTSGNGGTSTGNALTSNTTARGSVTINSFAYGGTTNVGHVPSGGSATTFLRGDGTWVTPTDTQPPVDDVTASTNDALLGISVSPTTGNVVVGLDIYGLTDDQLDEAPSSYDVLVYNDADAINRKLNLEDLASHINSVTSKAYTISDTATITYPFTLTAATQNDTIIQLVDTVTNETVYADVDRISTTQATITFASTPTNDIRVLVQKIG